MHRSQSILNESQKFLFSQKGMYTRYLLKYSGVFTVFIDCAIIEFQKHRLINHGNTISGGQKVHVSEFEPSGTRLILISNSVFLVFQMCFSILFLVIRVILSYLPYIVTLDPG